VSDYRELPEPVAAAVAALIDAESKAHPDAHKCKFCRRAQTARIDECERVLIFAIRREYGASV
jgi:hypothetical protein